MQRCIGNGRIKALVVLGEDPTKFGISGDQLKQLPSFILMNILRSTATPWVTALLPSATYAEKRGSMINGRGRLQRLNRAVRSPGEAKEDWEILRDLIQAVTGNNGIYSIEEVFRQMADSVPQFSGLSLSKIGDLGQRVLETPADTTTPAAPGEPAEEKVEARELAREQARAPK